MITKQDFQKMKAIRLRTRELWVKACEFDGMPSKSKFVCFSPDNPFEKEYNAEMIKATKLHAKFIQHYGYDCTA